MSDAALLAWEYEGGAVFFVTQAAAIHALRVRLEQAERRRDMLSVHLAPERYLAADSMVRALEAQLDAFLAQAGARRPDPGSATAGVEAPRGAIPHP